MTDLTTLAKAQPRDAMVQNGTTFDLPEKTRWRYESLANLLLLGMDIRGIVEFGRISRSALYRLMRRPDFQAVLREVREHNKTLAQQVITGLLEDALSLVREVINSPVAPLALRLRAAELVIDRTLGDTSEPRPPVDHRHIHVSLTEAPPQKVQ